MLGILLRIAAAVGAGTTLLEALGCGQEEGEGKGSIPPLDPPNAEPTTNPRIQFNDLLERRIMKIEGPGASANCSYFRVSPQRREISRSESEYRFSSELTLASSPQELCTAEGARKDRIALGAARLVTDLKFEGRVGRPEDPLTVQFKSIRFPLFSARSDGVVCQPEENFRNKFDSGEMQVNGPILLNVDKPSELCGTIQQGAGACFRVSLVDSKVAGACSPSDRPPDGGVIRDSGGDSGSPDGGSSGGDAGGIRPIDPPDAGPRDGR